MVEPVRRAPARDLADEVARRYLSDQPDLLAPAGGDHLRDIARRFTPCPDPVLLAAARRRVAQQIAVWQRQITPDRSQGDTAMTIDSLAADLTGAFPVADDRCSTTDPDGRRCIHAAWHSGGRPEWGEDTPHEFEGAA